MSDTSNVLVSTGRRKTSTARVRITPGTGVFIINGKPHDEYCYDENLVRIVENPLTTVEKKGQFDIVALVEGGGPIGQATAISHGLSRSLEKFDPELRTVLKKAGLLRRDPRRRERKKAGQPGARKRFQFSKR
ncbi:MAG: 30S ribosomal protein S9 [Verrucomicrobia bacterium]|nr:30S ribosomal protein S9 [Verrucomicrobiota bacterium]